MSAIFPKTVPAARAAAAPMASRETTETVRRKVRQMLEQADAFGELPADKREALAKGLVQIGSYLAEPDGIRLKPGQQSPQVRALAGDDGEPLPNADQPEFGTALKTGVQQAGALMDAVNFPDFVTGLIDGVFNSIVTSSIQQMEAYAKLVADVSKSLNQFRDDNTTHNQGRDQLVEQFPDIFQLQMGGGDWGDFGGFGDEPASTEPRVVVRPDIDERRAIERINQSLPLEKPLTRLDDELVEALLVPAARTQIATGRQQLLATLVMLGINRIVVTDGRISAKVMYDFQARDNLKYRYSATKFDHEKDAFGNVVKTQGREGTYERSNEQGTAVRDKDGNVVRTGWGGGPAREGGNSYAKGDYKYTEKPIIKMMSTSQLQNDASLQARASLAGQVEVNFKSDYLPLEKMANPEAIAAIQMNAQPGMVKTMAGRPAPAPPAAAGGQAPASTANPTPAPAPASP
ncbi:hypothetical protein GCM10027359_06550 [Marilutibacter aestuarii]